MKNQELLAQIGLSEAEASIYLAALELGESLPKHLAEKAQIKRPTLYKILPDLFAKGLLTQTIKGKRRYLVAEDPELLIEKKQSELKMLEEKIPEGFHPMVQQLRHMICLGKLMVDAAAQRPRSLGCHWRET